jgi:hypothetical protein
MVRRTHVPPCVAHDVEADTFKSIDRLYRR